MSAKRFSTEEDRLRAASVYAALSLFLYNLYTAIDSIVGNVAPSALAESLPSPYDVYSLGIVVVLAALFASSRLAKLVFRSSVLASGATLMALGPLYVTLGLPGQSSFALAFLGGCGKAIVSMQVGLALGSLGVRRLVRVVPIAMSSSLVLGSMASLQPHGFAIVSLIAAPLSAWFAFRAAGVAKGGSGKNRVGCAVRKRDLGYLAAAIFCMAAGCILCSDPVQATLLRSTLSPFEVLLMVRVAAAVMAALLILGVFRFSFDAGLGSKMVAFSSVLGVTIFLAFSPQVLEGAYGLTLIGRFVFQMLFWVIAPLSFFWIATGRATVAGKSEQSGMQVRPFALLLGCYCGGLSAVFMVLRFVSAHELSSWMVASGTFLLLVGALFLAPDRLLPQVFAAADSHRVPLDEALAAMAAEGKLSKRESEVMALAARGRDSKVIQETLGVSASTVSTHMQNIYRKLGIHSRQELIDRLEEAMREQSAR